MPNRIAEDFDRAMNFLEAPKPPTDTERIRHLIREAIVHNDIAEGCLRSDVNLAVAESCIHTASEKLEQVLTILTKRIRVPALN